MPHNLLIESVNLDSKCWVVRSGVRYRYISQFFDGDFIATGHLDDYELEPRLLGSQCRVVTRRNFSIVLRFFKDID